MDHLVFDEHGNAIESFDDERAVGIFMVALANVDHASACELTVISYDADGMPVGEGRMLEDFLPDVTMEAPSGVAVTVRVVTASSTFGRLRSTISVAPWLAPAHHGSPV